MKKCLKYRLLYMAFCKVILLITIFSGCKTNIHEIEHIVDKRHKFKMYLLSLPRIESKNWETEIKECINDCYNNNRFKFNLEDRDDLIFHCIGKPYSCDKSLFFIFILRGYSSYPHVAYRYCIESKKFVEVYDCI